MIVRLMLALMFLVMPTVSAMAASLTIAAASSMSGALTEIGDIFQKKTGTTPVFSFGSSGMLAKQIENGAPFDVFVSADEELVEKLRVKGLLDPGSVATYAVGRIGIITQKGSGIVVRSIKDLPAPLVRKFAIANPGHAPYGKAAKEALDALGLWEDVRRKVVFGENVRQVYQFVATGNADAAISALSLHNPDEMEFIPIDTSLHQPLRQGMGMVSTSAHRDKARAFMDFMLGKQGQDVLHKYGFLAP